MDVIALYDGTILEVHSPVYCEGEPCCVHHPSDHPLRDAPLLWLPAIGCMARLCEHLRYHPDPDDLLFRDLGVARRHVEDGRCDGCCGERRHDDSADVD